MEQLDAEDRNVNEFFTIPSATVQGVLVPGRIEKPYALDVAGGSRHSPSSS